MTNILIGQNNVGKSNLMRAIDIAFNGSRTISEDDIYVEKDEHLSKDKSAIIDIKNMPCAEWRKEKRVFRFLDRGIYRTLDYN